MFKPVIRHLTSPDLHLGVVIVLIGGGWIFLTQQTLAMGGLGALRQAGPGMAVLDWARFYVLGDVFAFETAAAFCLTTDGPWQAIDFLRAFVMWFAMVGAMMLPRYLFQLRSAHYGSAPKTQIFFLAGYLAVWAVFCIAALVLQWGLTRAALLTPFMMIENDAVKLAISVLIAADCLFRQNQTTSLDGTADLSAAPLHDHRAWQVWQGLRAGRTCVRSCWILMMASFLLGLMNLVGMAALSVAMILTATRHAKQTYRVFGGTALLLAASSFLALG